MNLQCPAILLLARPGAAADGETPYPSGDAGALSTIGREQVGALADHLAEDRIAACYTSSAPRAVQSAALAAERLGLPFQELAGLAGARVGAPKAGPPGGETGPEKAARVRDALETIADLHRGERVLVFTHGGILGTVLTRLALDATGAAMSRPMLPPATPVTLECADHGWTILHWPSAATPRST